MATEKAIHVSVKFLNGDLLFIEHLPSRGFNQFSKAVCDAHGSIPYGCISFMRLNGNDEKIATISDVADGDVLFAFVDISRVYPIVTRGGNISIPNEDHKMTITTYRIGFYSKEYDKEWGEQLWYGDIDIVYNEESHLFALRNAFQTPTSHETKEFEKNKFYFPLLSTHETRWYESVTECIASFPYTHFPLTDDNYQFIQQQILTLQEVRKAWIDD